MANFLIAIIGEYNENYLPKAKTNVVLEQFKKQYTFDFHWISTEKLVQNPEEILEKYSGIWLGSGSYKSNLGAVNGIHFARKNNIPFLGTCSGFGYAVLEFAKNELHFSDIPITFDLNDIADDKLFLEPLTYCGRDHYEIFFKTKTNSLADKLYNDSSIISETSHCSYSLNQNKLKVFEANDMRASAFTEDDEVKILEYSKNEFYLLTLFYPQLNSNYKNSHPILKEFMDKASKRIV